MTETYAFAIASGIWMTAALLWGSVKSSEAIEKKLDTLIHLTEDATRDQRDASFRAEHLIHNMMP